MSTFRVDGTVTVNATVDVEAETAEEAYTLAQQGDFHPLSQEVDHGSVAVASFEPDGSIEDDFRDVVEAVVAVFDGEHRDIADVGDVAL